MHKTIFPFETKITYEQRKRMMMQEPQLIWLTGLSGAGKTTLAVQLEHYFFHKNYKVYVLDGDNIRNGLNRDLLFSKEDRMENLRRVSEVAKLFLDAGFIVICAFISPYLNDRALIREIVGEQRFIEVFVSCSLEVCEGRDVKGLYHKARKGIIPEFTGISSPYEEPPSPDVEVRTAEESVEESLAKIIQYIEPKLQVCYE
ncbi:MAG TPA: adenylyl-sulfate kinase [Flavisolibacter sp.]|jgi:adenylylsulfate kinase|nr:adenylyl-sulfate kinase [Flavisolibacter sp.]